MKILKLKSENIKKLRVVEIIPEGALITIAGKNGAGKSSVLDSIAYALGGTSLVPAQPIRNGEADAKITVELDDLIVTRRFYREKLVSKGDGHGLDEGGEITFGETKSTLTVTNKEGAKYPSPQAVLDKLMGKLTFDPLQFARATAKEQDDVLRRLVGLDVTPFVEARKVAAVARSFAKKTHDIKSAQLLNMPQHQGVPNVELSLAAITEEKERADELRQLAVEAEHALAINQERVARCEAECQRSYATIESLKKRLETEQQLLDASVKKYEESKLTRDASGLASHDAEAAVPDVALIRKKFADAELLNKKIRENKQFAAVDDELDNIMAEIRRLDNEVKAADQGKEDALRAVKFPIEGLGLSDDGVTFGGIPFEQASSSEQLRVSVMVGLALNPTLKVLLVRNGNMLDADSLKALAELAELEKAQVWIEFVSESAEGVSVMLEDGSLQVETV